MTTVEPHDARTFRSLMLVAALLVALAGMLLYLTWSSRDSAGAEAMAGRREESPASSELAVSIRPPPVETTRSPLDTAFTSAQSDPRPASSGTVPLDALRGRVIDAHRAPIAGARVSIERRELPAGFTTHQDHEIARAREAVAETASDARGEFEFALDRGAAVDLHVDAPGYCPVVVADRNAGEFVEVTLSTGFLVFGRVTRERDGAPIAGAKIRVFRPFSAFSLDRETRTAADGRYEIRFGFQERATLEVVPELEQRSDRIALVLGPDGTVEKNVALPEGIVVVGRVSAADSGAPIAGATVGDDHWDYQHSVLTNARGEYRLSGFPGGRLQVRAPGFGGTTKANLPGVSQGVMKVDFELARALSAQGRVLGADRMPLSDVLATAVSSDVGSEGWRGDWLHARTDSDGRFRIDDLARDMPHALMLSKHGHGTQVYDFPSTGLDDADVDLGTFVLGTSALIAGVVRDASGRGLVGASVTLRGTNSDRSRLRDEPHAEPITGGCSIDPAQRYTRTDAAGRFSFGDLSAGEYSIDASSHDRPRSASVGRVVQEGQVIDDVEILLPAAGASIVGRVTDSEGEALAGVWVVAFAEGRGDVSNASTNARGEFKIQHLDDASVYQLDFTPFGVEDALTDEPLIRTTVDRVAANSGDVIVVMRRGAWIRGTVVDASGAALLGYDVRALDAGETGPMAMPRMYDVSVATDAAGEFAIRVPSDGVYTVELRGPTQSERGDTVLVTVPNTAAGTRGLVLTVP